MIHIQLLFITSIVPTVQAAKILYLSFPVYSHLQNLANLADAMREEGGHEAWITAPPSLEKRLNLDKRHIKSIPLNDARKLDDALDYIMNSEEGSPMKQFWKTGKFPISIQPTLYILDIMLKDELFMKTIQEIKFDLVILDNTPIAQSLCIIPYRYDIPFIYLGVNYDAYIARIPFLPSFVPYKGLPYSDEMTFTERFHNTMFFAFLIFYNPFNYRNAVKMYAPEKPNINVIDIQRQASLFLIEWNSVLDYPAPDMPHVIKIGQISPKEQPQYLSTELQNFLSQATHGVILVSFGSIAPATSNKVLDKLTSAFNKTKYHFIIKGSYTNTTEKNLVVDWMPQKTLLKNSKIKLFVTHCGANSLAEAIINGVPMLGFPLFAEQPGNAYRMQSRGYGLKMSLFDASEEDIIATINEVIDDPKYKNNVVKASHILQSRQVNGREMAVYWIEHVLKFGSTHLKSSSIDLPWYQYLLLDILFVVIILIIFTVSVVYYCLKFLFRKCFLRKKKYE